MIADKDYQIYAKLAADSLTDFFATFRRYQYCAPEDNYGHYRKKLFLLGGNGGSASMADHMTGELIGRFDKERQPISAMCMNVGTSAITCISNDYGYNNLFVRQITAFDTSKVFIILFSTSGRSQNVVNSIKYMDANNIKGVLFTSQSVEVVSSHVHMIKVQDNRTEIIQLVHEAIMHYLCNKVDSFMLDAS